jgi:DnaJ-domain-containing protein 1
MLAESLASRRRYYGDLAVLGQGLRYLASGEEAQNLARYIHAILDPGYESVQEPELKEHPDPWMILGMSPDSPLEDIKSGFRKLAIQFHPDSLRALDEKHQKDAERAFIIIQEAYKKVMKTKTVEKERVI